MSPKYLHRFMFYDPEVKVELSDFIEIFTLELVKLHRNTDGTALYDWASFIAAEREEEFLEKYDFPDLVSHRVLYKELMDALSKVGEKSIMERDPYQFMDFLKKWWVDHIGNKDRVFRDYLLEKSFL